MVQRSRDTAAVAAVPRVDGVLLFWLVLDSSVSEHSGTSNTFGMVPMVALVGAMSSVHRLFGLRREQTTGLLSKMWTLPTHRASAMTGRLLAESVRIVITVSAVPLVGMVIGFRIHSGLPGYLGIIAVATGFGLSFSMMITALALMSRDSHIVEWTAIGTQLAMFFNTGFVPADSYPAWLRPAIEYQPMSCTIDTIRALGHRRSGGAPDAADAGLVGGVADRLHRPDARRLPACRDGLN